MSFLVIKDGYTTNESHLLYINYNGVICDYSSLNGGTFSRYEGKIHDELITAARKAAVRCYSREAEFTRDDPCGLVFGSDGKLYYMVVSYTPEYDETDEDLNVLKEHPYREYYYYVCLDPVEQAS